MYNENEFNNRTDNQKVLDQLNSIEAEISCVWSQIDKIDTLLHSEILAAIKGVTRSVEIVGGWIAVFVIAWLISNLF